MAAPTGITADQVDADSVVDADLTELIKEWIDYLNGQTGGVVGVPNGSFEIDADDDGDPDNWDTTPYAGGAVSLETTSPIEGAASLKFAHPGGASNGGGYADSEFIECSSARPFILGMVHYSSAAGMKNKVTVRFFDKGQVDLSADDTVYESTTNPTSAHNILMAVSPPAPAKYFKIRLIGGFTDTDVAGNAFFDQITIQPLVLKRGHSPISFGTISEQSRAVQATFVDVGSCTISLPLRELPATISFSADMRVSTATGYMRFRVGSEYSNEESETSTSYQTHSFSLTMADATKDEITMYMQLKNSAATVYGRMTSPAGGVVLDVDEIFV